MMDWIMFIIIIVVNGGIDATCRNASVWIRVSDNVEVGIVEYSTFEG